MSVRAERPRPAQLAAAWASPGSLLGVQHLGPHLDLLDQHLRLNDDPPPRGRGIGTYSSVWEALVWATLRATHSGSVCPAGLLRTWSLSESPHPFPKPLAVHHL